jgi:hypothetical protein
LYRSASPCSNAGTGCRFGRTYGACLDLIDPFAAGKGVSRLRRIGQWSFALKLDLNRPHSPPLSDLPRNSGATMAQGRSSKRASLWTVEVEHVLETHQHLPRNAATPFPRSEMARSIFNRPRNRVRSGNPYPHSSPGMFIGTKQVPDKNLHIIRPFVDLFFKSLPPAIVPKPPSTVRKPPAAGPSI